MEIQSYLNRDYPCACGRVHQTDLKDVIVEAGANQRIGSLVKSYGIDCVLLVGDVNTYPVAGYAVESSLKSEGIDVIRHIYPERELVPDEAAINALLSAVTPDISFMVTVGSGTLNDISKYVCSKKKIDYLIAATAPSMDGYASTVAPIIENGMKVTYEAKVAKAIVGDLDVLKNAPKDMINAGVGDILGKYTCLCDWRLAHIINDEYYCQTIADIVDESIRTVTDNIDGVARREEEAIRHIMEALILSGIAMSYAGNSRPASGSEHHLSHYWEMMFLQQHRKALLHGTKVGIATVIVDEIYQSLRHRRIDFNAALDKAFAFDEKKWETLMEEVYGPAAAGVIELEKSIHKNSPVNVGRRIKKAEENWRKITTMIDEYLPKPQKIEAILREIGAPHTYEQVGIDHQMYENSIRWAKELRNRYGLLQMLFDLNLIDESWEF